MELVVFSSIEDVLSRLNDKKRQVVIWDLIHAHTQKIEIEELDIQSRKKLN